MLHGLADATLGSSRLVDSPLLHHLLRRRHPPTTEEKQMFLPYIRVPSGRDIFFRQAHTCML